MAIRIEKVLLDKCIDLWITVFRKMNKLKTDPVDRFYVDQCATYKNFYLLVSQLIAILTSEPAWILQRYETFIYLS